MSPLRTISEILTDFSFLKYSTRKRNLAYQLQYLDFKVELLRLKSIYGAVQACLMRDLVITITNIIEYLLFVSLGTIYGKDPKPHKFPQLVGQAKSKHLISKVLAKDLNKIDELRNKIHPSKQKAELDIACFTKKQVDFCLASLNLLKNELNEFFGKRDMQADLNKERCSYYGWSQVLFPDFNCPYCGGFHL